MLLSSPPYLSLPTLERGVSLPSSARTCNAVKDSSSALRSSRRNARGRLVINASKEANSRPIFDVVFQPFEEVKKELLLVPTVPQDSIARQKFSDQCEVAINEQIKFFKDSSIGERQHAEKFMEYQNKRGGKVKLQSMLMPVSEFEHMEKGDALHAMELTLSLEKLTNKKLLNLHKVAAKNNDVQLVDFVESDFLVEQVEAIKKISEYVAQLRRVGRGHGVWNFDQMLLNNAAAA